MSSSAALILHLLAVTAARSPHLGWHELPKTEQNAVQTVDPKIMEDINSIGSSVINEAVKESVEVKHDNSVNHNPSHEESPTELDVNLEEHLLGKIFEEDILLTPDQAEVVLLNYKNVANFGFSNQNSKLDELKTVIESEIQTVRDEQPTNPNDSKRIHLQKRKVAKRGSKFSLWEKMPIQYSFNATVPENSRSVIKFAIKLWEDNTCIRWEEGGKDTDRIEIINGEGCLSYVGKTGGVQSLMLSSTRCAYVGIAAHELGHSLGFFHEQNRPDQEMYIKVNYSNIHPKYHSNFMTQPANVTNNYSVPYDYGSVMHYDPWAKAFTLSNDKYAIIAKQKQYQWTMGQRIKPSFADYKQVNQAYCSGICPTPLDCLRNGYSNPNNCNKCKCPEGFSGKYCNKLAPSDPGCGGYVYAKSTKKFVKTVHASSRECYWLIKAPKGETIKITVKRVSYKCIEPCSWEYLEINLGNTHYDTTGFRLCCNDSKLGVMESSNNELLLISSVTKPSHQSFGVTYWAESTSIISDNSTKDRGNLDAVSLKKENNTPTDAKSMFLPPGSDQLEMPYTPRRLTNIFTPLVVEPEKVNFPINQGIVLKTELPKHISRLNTKIVQQNEIASSRSSVTPNVTEPISDSVPVVKTRDRKTKGTCGECGPWSNWTPCSYSCGACGRRSTKRKCPKGLNGWCSTAKVRICNIHGCSTTHVPRPTAKASLDKYKGGCCQGVRNSRNLCIWFW